MEPIAYARIIGNKSTPNLRGIAYFYRARGNGLFVEVEVSGLPENKAGFYGLHIHENGDCTIPFDKTGGHYNPYNVPHPEHAGDLPPLLGNNGYAYSCFYTSRLTPADIMKRSIIIHSGPDDFTSQPAGNSGNKIGCGVIRTFQRPMMDAPTNGMTDKI